MITLQDNRNLSHLVHGEYKEVHDKNTQRKVGRRRKVAEKAMKTYLSQHGRKIDLEDTGMEAKTGYKIGGFIYVPGPYGDYVAVYSPNKLQGLRRQAPATEQEPVAAGM